MSTELELLKERATKMGIKFHPGIGVDKLKEKIETTVSGGAGSDSTGETIAQRNARLKREASRKVRIQLTCMNPAKKEWQGEIISVGNAAIGTIKMFVPFVAEDGWHVPVAILDVLRERRYQAFKTTTVANGMKKKTGYQAKEFAIELLPDLTKEELRTLAAKQASEASDNS